MFFFRCEFIYSYSFYCSHFYLSTSKTCPTLGPINFSTSTLLWRNLSSSLIKMHQFSSHSFTSTHYSTSTPCPMESTQAHDFKAHPIEPRKYNSMPVDERPEIPFDGTTTYHDHYPKKWVDHPKVGLAMAQSSGAIVRLIDMNQFMNIKIDPNFLMLKLNFPAFRCYSLVEFSF